MAHTYDSLSVGDTFTFTRSVSMADVQSFADVTGDDNPIHISEEAGAASRFGQPVVHGVFLLGLASKVLGRDFPGDGSVAVSLSAKFLRPVPVGSEITVEVKVAEKMDRHKHVRIRLYCYMNGKMCVGGEAVVIPPPEA
ncbi:MaoC family dehydratase [Rubricoccus marinus]|uniref:Dehydratase n=1 Tax=Rubricoccus marinus TaxID=716817 RepID=A0A259U340_9BACT|nr:MaoC family dehydratase [Rubricoccus marinus]OZC04248.1 dehydratase [Rubricoccus marinus]